ncbi:unnamed protein product [Dovyalis caffra]|uniref:Uncharacterized protein n=1 Tax=Dovyalis caffra TaxID=77055 RepID=A0AAV1SQK5_9ROSI|nr:unnamed protein product [Dovyalis caffra]
MVVAVREISGNDYDRLLVLKEIDGSGFLVERNLIRRLLAHVLGSSGTGFNWMDLSLYGGLGD